MGPDTTKPPTISLFKAEPCGLGISINGVTRPGEGATIETITFNWGDGAVEKHFFPATHTYSAGGQFQVTVTSTQSDGKTATATAQVTVAASNGKGPTLSLLKPSIMGLDVAINGVTLPGDMSTSIKRSEWDWGDGTVADSFFPAKHSYATSGTRSVKVTSHQCDAQTATESVEVTVTK